MYQKKINIIILIQVCLLVLFSSCSARNYAQTPTLSPIPTLIERDLTIPFEEASSIILELHSDNGGCEEISCWWGILPGHTSWDDAYEVISPIGKVTDGFRSREGAVVYFFEFAVPQSIEPDGYLRSAMWIADEKIMAIEVHDGINDSLPVVLENYGPPEEIWIFVGLQSSNYYIELFYQKQGVLIRFESDIDQILEDNVIICPNELKSDQQSISSILYWNPREEINYRDILSEVLFGLDERKRSRFFALDKESSDIDAIEFYNSYIDPSATHCLNIWKSAILIND